MLATELWLVSKEGAHCHLVPARADLLDLAKQGKTIF